VAQSGTRNFGRLDVIDFKKRETGIEPATSSLGNWATIESKQQSRLWHAIPAQEIAAFPCSEIRVLLNGARLGHTHILGDKK
jgi:hypothetical protein